MRGLSRRHFLSFVEGGAKPRSPLPDEGRHEAHAEAPSRKIRVGGTGRKERANTIKKEGGALTNIRNFDVERSDFMISLRVVNISALNPVC